MKIAVYTGGILIPFLFHIFHILRFQVSGVRNDEHRRQVSLYFRLNPGLFDSFLKKYLIVIQEILNN